MPADIQVQDQPKVNPKEGSSSSFLVADKRAGGFLIPHRKRNLVVAEAEVQQGSWDRNFISGRIES